MRRSVIGWVILGTCLAVTSTNSPPACSADDVVTLVPSQPGGPSTEVRGTVIDYTGMRLVLQTAVGQSTISSAKVFAVETETPKGYEEGLRLLASPKSNEAVRALQAIVPFESRPWMRRDVKAKLAIALHNSGRTFEAGLTFLDVAQEDMHTIHFDAMPLAWYSYPPDFERDRKARKWMEGTLPHEQLLGASWLLGTSDRPQAIQVLQSLSRSKIPQIALLANAQLWQTRIVTATENDVQQWEKQIDSGVLSKAALAGPRLVIGKAWRQLGQYERAALLLMQAPILYPTHRAIAAESLLQAGRALEQAQQPEEARRLMREVIDQYGDQPPRQQAESMLRRLPGANSN